MSRLFLFFTLSVFACSPDRPTGSLDVLMPERGLSQLDTSVLIAGRFQGQVDIIRVNGTSVDVNAAGEFSHVIELGPGTHHVEVVAITPAGTSHRDVRTVTVGPIDDGAVSDAVVLHIGDTGLRDASREIAQTIDSQAIRDAIMAEPVKDAGSEAGCDSDLVTVTSTDTSVSLLSMYGLLDGLGGESTFNPFGWTFEATYSDSTCALVTDSFSFATEELHVPYRIGLTLEDGVASVSVDGASTVFHHPFELDAADVDPEVVDRVAGDIHESVAGHLTAIAIPQIEAKTSAWLNSFTRQKQISIAGAEIEQSLVPTTIDSSWSLQLESRLSKTSERVVTSTTPPVLDSIYASAAVSADAVNQLLAAVWREGGFDGLIENVTTIEMLAPPFLHVRDSGPAIVFGDWVASQNGGSVVMFGELTLGIKTTEAGMIQLVVDSVELESLPLSGSPDLVATAAEKELESRVNLVLEALAIRLAPYAWPSLELQGAAGYLIIDTAL